MVEAATLTICGCEDGRPCKCSLQVKRSRVRAHSYGYKGPDFTAREWFALLKLYEHRCLRCGSSHEPLTVDHIQPLSLGGSNAIDNIQPLCERCNGEKGGTVADYRQPRSPPLEIASQRPNYIGIGIWDAIFTDPRLDGAKERRWVM